MTGAGERNGRPKKRAMKIRNQRFIGWTLAMGTWLSSVFARQEVSTAAWTGHFSNRREHPTCQASVRILGLGMKMADVKQPVKEGFFKPYENVQDKVTEKAQYAARTTDDWVHENPWQAIAIVAVTSLILGVLLARPRIYQESD